MVLTTKANLIKCDAICENLLDGAPYLTDYTQVIFLILQSTDSAAEL